MTYTKPRGFIVHPYETGNNKYHASYGNHNKTVKSFNTLREAKNYLKNKGVTTATYDAPSGAKVVKTASTSKPTQRKPTTKKPRGHNFGFGAPINFRF